MNTPEGRSGRIPALDGVRGLAILAVVVHHYYHVKLLWMGVDLFFILSGFLITTILLREKQQNFRRYIGHFYQRRAQRILPPYVLTLLLAAFVYGTWWLHWWPYYLGGMNLMYTTGVPQVDSLPLWSLAVEEQFYLLWPLVVYVLPHKRLITVASTLIVLAPVLRYLCQPLFSNPLSIYMLLPFRMDTLATGALIALLWSKRSDAPGLGDSARRVLFFVVPAGLLAAFITIAVFAHLGLNTFRSTPLSSALLFEASLVITTCIFCAALLKWFPSFFTLKPFLWLGTVSYTVYLVHNIVRDYFVPRAAASAGPALALAVTAGYATLSWKYLERPILHYGRSDARLVVDRVEA